MPNGITGGIAAGGQQLGNAHATITLDTSSLAQAASTARLLGRQLEQALGGISSGAKQAETSLQRVTRRINDIRGELVGLGLGAGLLTRIGVGMAGSFEETQIQLTGMLRSEQRAITLTEELRKKAAAAGLPFRDMAELTTILLPGLRGNTEELERQLGIARRLAVLNPMQGLTGAGVAIREFISGGGTDTVSLRERFNIDRVSLKQSIDEFEGDLVGALDAVLERMGITSEVADRMGRSFNASFRAARDAAVQFLAEGFTPMLEVLTPLLQSGAQWLSQLRETDPALATATAGLLAVTTVGAPALLLFNQLVQASRALNVQWATLGRAGLVVGGVIGGFAVGRAAGTALGGQIRQARGQQPLTGDQVEQNLRNVVFNIAVTLAKVDIAFLKVTSAIDRTVIIWQAGMMNGLASFLRALASILPPGLGGDLIGAGARIYENEAVRLENVVQAKRQNLRVAIGQRLQGVSRLGARLNIPGFQQPSDDGAARALQEAQINQEIIDAKVDYVRQVQAIERNANNARIEATQQYEQQRTQVIAQYELGIAREAEDFARQRARQAQQLERSIADIREDAAQREAEWWTDLQEKINEIQADGNERIAEIEEDYHKNRERRERDHRDNLFAAAGRLDAVAVLNEQKRFAKESQDQADAHEERINKERENLAEQIDEANKAHQERLDDARRADAERITDLQENLAEQQRLEDEDRAIRLQRQAEDHANQLAQMATAHAAQMAQISMQEAEELKAAEDAHLAQLAELKLYNEEWKKLEDARLEASLKSWDKWWEGIGKRFEQFGPMEKPSFPTTFEPTQIPGFATGGPVHRTGAALLHAGEFVLNRATASALGMVNAMSQQRLVGAVAGGNRSFSVGDIHVYAAPGMDVQALAQAVDQRLQSLFERWAQ